MVYVTPGIRWSIGVWCAATLGLVAGGISQGLQPATLGVLLFVTAAPVIVLVTLTRFRREDIPGLAEIEECAVGLEEWGPHGIDCRTDGLAIA